MAKADLCTPHPPLLKTVFGVMSFYETYVVPLVPSLRAKSLDLAYDLIKKADESSAYLCIALPVKSLHMLSHACMGDTEAVRKHSLSIRDYLWVSKEGMGE